ncbi:response regulator [Methylobacterium nodulans]|uniref:histidine kinase n=1 Tax=Methylobacterium nodulans (strain LMG 21967 / CNCM I-2342 / ORS 2060) TaxID=460265 RepID=B8IRA9_METNO|nr:response regulator [Methylobacterium nodulans]ACL58649.1 response regulator receiver protein [Methylobacterium nodulans ORS 2060]
MLDSVRIPLKVLNAAQLAGVAAVVVALAWLAFTLASAPDRDAAIRRAELVLSRAYADAIDHDLNQIEADARMLALLLRSAGSGPAASDGLGIMRDFLRLKPAYREAALVAADGTVTIASNPRRRTTGLGQQIALLRIRRAQIAVVTGPGEGDTDRPFDLLVSLGVPGQSDCLVLGVGPAFFSDIADRVRRSFDGDGGSATFSVRGADGRLLGGPATPHGEGMSSPTRAGPSLASPGWAVTARLAPDAIPPPRRAPPALALGFALVLGAAGLGYVLAHRTARLLAQLAAPSGGPAEAGSRIRECDDLARALLDRARSTACMLAGAEMGLDRIQGRLTSFEAMSGWTCWEIDPGTQRVVWADRVGLPAAGPVDLTADMAALKERIEAADRALLDRALESAARTDGLHDVVLRLRATPPGTGSRVLVRVLRRPASCEGGWRLHVLSRALRGQDEEGAVPLKADRRRNPVLRRVTDGIVHDINDILTVILASLGTLKRRNQLEGELARFVDTALAGALRGRALTRSMLTFVRSEDETTAECDLSVVIASFVPFLQANVLHNTPVVDRLPPHLPKLLCSERTVEVILLNIALHLRDLGLQGLAIAATEEEADGDEGLGLAPGPYLRLLVASGRPAPGSPPRTRGPTTLAMVAPLVRRLRGGWRLRDDGSGEAAFLAEIWLPALARQAAIAAAPSSGRAPLRVLLVESDSLVRMSVADALADLGHGVVQAASADHALRLLGEQADFDVMIVDQSMPVMSGLQLAAAVVRQHPRIRIVLASPRGQLPGAARPFLHLEKPFRPEDLAAVLQRAEARAAA